MQTRNSRGAGGGTGGVVIVTACSHLLYCECVCTHTISGHASPVAVMLSQAYVLHVQ